MSPTTKILLVEDEERLASAVKGYLEDFACDVHLAHTSREALNILHGEQFDLLILDWTLPDSTGLEICRTYLSSGGTAPVLFLTSHDSMDYKALGFESGCDDYLTKPFDLRELHMRIKALLRRGERPSARLKAGALTLDQESLRVFKGGEEIKVTKTEYNVLLVLLSNPKKVLSVDTIIDQAYPSEKKPSKEGLQMAINRLRKKLDDPGVDQKDSIIRSVFGRGYTIAENES